ncbi:hypothetical protein [Bordetella bronchiseptica]|uniref:hypothetical protein n=1 Tax=Bordetella bronchiseptica TaxID=518 RepID=UPI0004A01933|nr:hypothetical protein [Bordetella bronchiseptica]KAB1444182.1 hypothetical protein F7D00_21215 [Bordetella bronchiseptica]KAB1569288.1 hypothetical protein F7890_21215 [Bordetella bronchiseptica]KDD41087.1 hypothetical protein L532_4315 [Bordetella bronchiseptica OSU095]
MAENPFGDTVATNKNRFLVLLSAGKDNLSMTQAVVQNIKKEVDTKASPLWIDSRGIGLFVETELVAGAVWDRALAGLDHNQSEAFKDMVVLEIGQDWMARKDSSMTHWLASHVGDPRIVPRDQMRRR